MLSLIVQLSNSQSIYFNKSYNYNDFSPALAVIEYENNYIFYGITNDSINNTVSVYLASIDSIGNLYYWNTISHPEKLFWAGYHGSGLNRVSNNGFICAGCVNHPDRTNAILYRFNDIGDTIWTKQYPDTINHLWTQFWDCNTSEDKGFIMSGNHTVEAYNTNILLIKTDSLGNEQWRKEYGMPGWIKHGYNVVQTPDKGYLLGCYEYIAGQDTTGDPVVMKVDSMGNFEWEKNIGGPTRDFFTQVCIANDGNFIAGTSISDSVGSVLHYSRIKIVKLSVEGEIVWEKHYTKTDIDNILYAIYPDNQGGYIACGRRNDYYNTQGNWTVSYGWLLKLNEVGDSIWYREYQYYTGTDHDRNSLYDLCFTNDGGYALAGEISNWLEPQTAWVIKVDSFGCDSPGCQTVDIFEPQYISKGSFLLYPNPASTEIQIDIRYTISNNRISMLIYDIFGRKQDEVIIPKRKTKIQINISSYPAGIYVATLKSEREILDRKKFVVR